MVKRKITMPTASLLLACIAFPSLVSANAFTGGQSGIMTSSTGNQMVQGARATVITPNTYPSLSSGQMTCVWPAVVGYSGGSIAQVGFAVEPGVGTIQPHYFMGWIPNGGSYKEIQSTVGPGKGSTHEYTVKKVAGGYWAGYVDTTQISSTNANVTPDGVQYYNENESTSTRYFGTSTSKLKFAQVVYLDGSASGSDSSLWTWKKPILAIEADANSQVDSSFETNSSWYSWDTH